MARRIRVEGVDGIPGWAVPWFEDGDEAGLSEEEVGLVRAWRKGNPQLRFVACMESEGFNRHPAFGPACDTYTCAFERMPRPRRKTEKKPVFSGKALHLCFTNADPDGMSSPVNVRVAVSTNSPQSAVEDVVNGVLEKLPYEDYDSADEYVEAVMEETGFKWDWDCVNTDLYFDI